MNDDELEELKKLTGLFNKPRIFKINIQKSNGETSMENLCSVCFGIINNVWDHEEWCSEYEPEPLADWVQKGSRENK